MGNAWHNATHSPDEAFAAEKPCCKAGIYNFFVSVHPRRCLGNAQNPAPELKSAAYPGAAKLRFVHLDENDGIFL